MLTVINAYYSYYGILLVHLYSSEYRCNIIEILRRVFFTSSCFCEIVFVILYSSQHLIIKLIINNVINFCEL